MSPEVIARIYEPFFTTHKEGIGLGMCNVKKFVDALEGKIEIESEENRGTKVYLRLKS
jgi:C4-dicarboxylate-specific signal transduction histidine kinase